MVSKIFNQKNILWFVFIIGIVLALLSGWNWYQILNLTGETAKIISSNATASAVLGALVSLLALLNIRMVKK